MKFKPEMLHCYLIGGSQDCHQSPEELVMKVKQALKAGITAFQYREKGSSQLNYQEKIQLGFSLKNLCHTYRVPFFVDDDFQLATKLQADGIHVGQKDQPIKTIIAAANSEMMVGYSCHTIAQVKQANSLAVDYLGSGPIFPTHSKDDADEAIGITGLRELTAVSQHPIVAIGGITEKNVDEILSTDVAGCSMISMILQSSDITSTVQTVRRLTDKRK